MSDVNDVNVRLHGLLKQVRERCATTGVVNFCQHSGDLTGGTGGGNGGDDGHLVRQRGAAAGMGKEGDSGSQRDGKMQARACSTLAKPPRTTKQSATSLQRLQQQHSPQLLAVAHVGLVTGGGDDHHLDLAVLQQVLCGWREHGRGGWVSGSVRRGWTMQCGSRQAGRLGRQRASHC